MSARLETLPPSAGAGATDETTDVHGGRDAREHAGHRHDVHDHRGHRHAFAEGELQTEIEELPRWRRRLRVTIPAARVAQERKRLLQSYAKKLKLPGFRPGKAPVDVIRKRLGPELDEQVKRELVQAAVDQALHEAGLDAIGAPEVQALELDPADTLHATVEFDVRPELTLSRTGGFRIDLKAPAVGPETVDRVLERLREERAELRPVERAAARGDVVVADVEPLEGAGEAGTGYQILLGSGRQPEVEAQLEGATMGDEREVRTTLVPEGGAGGSAAAEERRWRVRVQAVKERILPALDDEFARAASKVGTLEELRRHIDENLRLESAAQTERDVRERLIDAVAEANAVEVPESLVSRYLARLLEPREGEREAPDPARDAEIARILRPGAERSLRRLLIVDTLARAEGLEPTDEEIDTYLRERHERATAAAASGAAAPTSDAAAATSDAPAGASASAAPLSPEEARRALERTGQLEDLRQHLKAENVFRFLKNQSTIRLDNDGSPAEPGS